MIWGEKMKAKCNKCGKSNYDTIGNSISVAQGHIELRQCRECYTRYKVLVMINGVEKNI